MLTRLATIATSRGQLRQVSFETNRMLSSISMSCFAPADVIVHHGVTSDESYAIKFAGIRFHRQSTIWVVDRRSFGSHLDLIDAGIAAKIGFLDGVGKSDFLLGMETLEALQYIFLVSLIAAPNMTSMAMDIIESLRLDMRNIKGGAGFGYQNFQADPCQNIKVLPLNGYVPPKGIADTVSSLLIFSETDRVEWPGNNDGYGVSFNLKLGSGILGTRLALVVMGLETDRAREKVNHVVDKMIMKPYRSILTQIDSTRTER